MAVEIMLRKLYDTFVPVDKIGIEVMLKMPMNAEYKGVFSQPRNAKFHRKYFTLLNFAYEQFEPEEVEGKYGIVPEKDRDQFREDIIILAGFYRIVRRVNGQEIVVAKSISFARMDQDEFDELYSKTITVVLKYVLKNYSGEDLENVVDQLLLGYA